jgi:hypothetical protein
MSAIPFRQQTATKQTILKLYNTPYALDPYYDRLASQGYHVLNGTTYQVALALAQDTRPDLILVYDDLAQQIDALKWLALQHGDNKHGWLATVPLLILADAARVPLLRKEEIPDRVVVLQRRADTLNQVTRTVKTLLHNSGRG